jgi:multiple sugar transport system permease protein
MVARSASGEDNSPVSARDDLLDVADDAGRAAKKVAARPRSVSARRAWSPYLFCLPFGLSFAVFILVPIGYAAYLSVHSLHRSGLGLSAPVQYFSGLSNYVQAFTDSALYDSIARVLLFGVVQVPVMLGLALVLALVLERPVTWMRGLFRTVYFLPYAVPGVLGALLWSFLYDPSLSPFNRLFTDIGAGSLNLLGPHVVLWSIANIVTWEWTGYNVIILSAGLQAIPPEIYEAARVDGASDLVTALRIKLPLVTPALILTGVFSIIGTLQLFTEPYVLSTITTTISSTYTPVLDIYNTALNDQNIYYGSAVAVVLAAVTFVLSFGALRLVRWRSGI